MKKVIVIGSANIDLSFSVEKLPNIGETVLGSDLMKFVGGKGLNQAVACSKVSSEIIFLGCLGNKLNKDYILNELNNAKIDFSYLKQSKSETGLALISRINNDNSIIVIPGANNEIDIEYIKNNLHLFKNCIVLIQNEIRQEINEFIIDYCFLNEIPIIYNPAPARKIDLELINKITYFTPNENEANFIFGSDNYEQIAKQYPNKVIVTLGENGIVYYDSKIHLIKPKPINVIDTTGAGDTFNGILCGYLANEFPLEQALRAAVVGATLSVSKIGAQTGMPSQKEIELEMD